VTTALRGAGYYPPLFSLIRCKSEIVPLQIVWWLRVRLTRPLERRARITLSSSKSFPLKQWSDIVHRSHQTVNRWLLRWDNRYWNVVTGGITLGPEQGELGTNFCSLGAQKNFPFMPSRDPYPSMRLLNLSYPASPCYAKPTPCDPVKCYLEMQPTYPLLSCSSIKVLVCQSLHRQSMWCSVMRSEKRFQSRGS
jgi:hypothetical protein